MSDLLLFRRWCAAVALPLAGLSGLVPMAAQAQDRIYRCGNEYTNDAEVAKSRGCKLMEGGNITIIQSPAPRAAPASSSAPRPAAPRNDSAEQRARDSDARVILQNELRRAEERLAQAREAYAGGEPPKEGIEGRNHQRYLDRVADLKAQVDRAQSDVNSIRNELSRMGGSAGGAGAAGGSAGRTASPGDPPGSRAAQ